jgi:hypothetical protein
MPPVLVKSKSRSNLGSVRQRTEKPIKIRDSNFAQKNLAKQIFDYYISAASPVVGEMDSGMKWGEDHRRNTFQLEPRMGEDG